jgi:hypothetical protein
MALDCIPAYARATFDLGHGSPQSESSPRPVTAGVRAPTSSQVSNRSSSCGVAQSAEHPPVKRAVAGSNPAATAIKGLAPASSADSKPARARVGTSEARAAFRWACRTQDRTEARVLDAGEGA